MGLIRWDGIDDLLKWATLATAIQNVPTAAWTILHGVRHNSLTGYQGYGYLLSGTGTGTVQLGVSKHGASGDVFHDFGSGRTYTTIDPVVNQDTLYVIAKANGTFAPNASKKVGSGGTWTHAAASGTQVNMSAAVQIQLGAWQGGDPFNGWKAVYAVWNVALTQAQREACGTNWQTSDIYNAHGTPPLILLEFDVAAGSIVNLGSASISGTAHVGTTLDSGQTFGGWNFDGIGASGTEYTDAATVVLKLTPSGVEERTSTDATTIPLALTPSGTDALAAIDSATAILTLTPSGTEIQADEYVDTGTVRLSFTPAGTDAFATIDAATALLTLTPSAVELQADEYIDSGTVRLSLAPTSSDVLAAIETGTVLLALTPSGTETQADDYVDANTVPLVLTPTSTDQLVGIEASTVVLSFTPSGTEFIAGQFTDADTTRLVLTPSSTEAFGATDTNEIRLALTPSAIDEHDSSSADAATIPLRFTVSSLDAYETTESGTVPLVLTPSSTSTFAGLDASTAILTFTPFGSEQYLSGSNEDEATVVLRFTPITTVELWFLFDTLLTATLTRTYSGVLQNRLWSATVSPRRWGGTLGNRLWSASILRKWSASLGRQ